MNCELESTRKEAAVSKFNVLPQYLLVRAGQNHKTPQDSRSPGRYFNLGRSEYEMGELTAMAFHDLRFLSRDDEH
jgi:hypothetical protein